jgi:hypothetical protein
MTGISVEDGLLIFGKWRESESAVQVTAIMPDGRLEPAGYTRIMGVSRHEIVMSQLHSPSCALGKLSLEGANLLYGEPEHANSLDGQGRWASYLLVSFAPKAPKYFFAECRETTAAPRAGKNFDHAA